MKLLFKDLSTNPYTQYKVCPHVGRDLLADQLPADLRPVLLHTHAVAQARIFVTLIYSIYSNLATDYGAMSAAEAAFGEQQPPPIPLEPPSPI